ncbi:glycoside hydrolase family 99-like domain-containing protein [Mesorhizobium sp. M1E.F.Ca.ET.041.01.1.1]|uniref:glycoside hydrolase family 99-like domain-containing protein n=1 Tax=Mesorhizobium sp. M1E.F.Ca.ET.041.01.1.1 TaxID=2496759 RepID=UPI000FCC2EC2|nr:glycoside hydrolase family 99-like domain-containing protein [Mesorhizobium sp. M1E.F.Ca.ET.041.01.1.1]RUW34044.1 glycosyltransferase [Mesorhizobium sp. M1E.F.Ca.ET.041.01.1.1]RWD89845.1 MAG: glycosyltransferase [Mesorhizobium sp.]TIV55810.1 MAG: glycosyltransferase [Mesorhizobium sp.]
MSGGINGRKSRIRKTLRQLYDEHDGKVSDKWSIYLDEYDRVFSDYRNKPVRILEIGVQNGGSLEIWGKYFSKAEIIIGCDINQNCGLLNFEDRRIGVIVGDANVEDTHRRILERSNTFDIVIDDGSHRSSDIIRTFARYFAHIADGGTFVVEDLHASYWQDFEGGLYDPLSSISFFKRLLDLINHEHWGLDRSRVHALAAFTDRYEIAFDEASLASIHSIEFLNSLCIVTKRPYQENVLGSRHVAGRDANVEQSIMSLDGATVEAAEQAANPWSLRSVTIEQETTQNRESVSQHATRLRALADEIVEARERIKINEAETARVKAEAAGNAQKVQDLQAQLSAAHAASNSLLVDRDSARSEEKRLHDVLDAVYASTSWRLTRPLRTLGLGTRSTVGSIRRTLAQKARIAWHGIPLSARTKQRLKGTAFSAFPAFFSSTNAYRAWKSFQSSGTTPELWSKPGAKDAVLLPKPIYVPRLEAQPVLLKPVRVVAFYLPQFHPIPENDEWWGEGFTEWTNVKPAQPQFVGHHQPHIPDELGYYDLRDVSAQRRQVELAKLYGVEGFCFYFYWFGGKRLLERPLENWLADHSLDLPFCLCWANENWSRRWDGLDHEILIAQDHSSNDDLAFIAEVAPYLRDPRYIRVDGKPLLLVYRPSLLPAAAETAQLWRKWCRENGIGEIFLAYTQSFESVPPEQYGFDAAVEFPPNRSAPPNVTHLVTPLNDDFDSTVYDWSVFCERSKNYAPRSYKLFRSVCPGWDNTARRRHGGGVFINNTPELYRTWLENAIDDTVIHVEEPSERLIFVNAWNEWAEGAHLEPDAANGFAYLQATREALEAANKKSSPRIVVVSHDAHPHGAQYLALAMARELGALGFDVDMIVLGDGPMLPRFAEVATVHRIDLASEQPERVLTKLQAMRDAGAEVAIVNTTVSGLLVPVLKEAGFRTVSLIHELPGVLHQYDLKKHATAINRHADSVVFAASIVQSGFEEFVGEPLSKSVIRPQGLLRKNPFKDRAEEARRWVCEQHGLASDTRYVLAVAFVDHRKGPDIFIDMAEEVLRTHPEMAFIWIGHFDAGMKEKIAAALDERRLTERVKFVGFVQEPMAYYAGASVYALTSREDPFPNAVLEAAEVGVPVVAFRDATGAADLIVEEGGQLAQNLDANDFAAKVRELLDSPAKASGASVASMRQYLLDLLHYATAFQRVSVVVPNYNYAHHLFERLNSIAGQTYPIYELVILDDGSTDGSVDVIKTFLAERQELDGELIVNEQNSGSVFRQWAKGIERCRGDVVWIAEADDFAAPDFLQELVCSFDDPSVVVAYSQSRQVDGNGLVLAEDYTGYTSDISDRWSSDYVRNGYEEISEAMAVKNTIPNVSAAIFQRLALCSAVAGLGDELFGYRVAGDWLVYLRVLLQGKIKFSAKRLNSHRRHMKSVTRGETAVTHLDEVRRMQELARSLVATSAETRRKADAWLRHVRIHLGIQDVDAA